MLLRPRLGEIFGGVILSFLMTGFFALLYSIENPLIISGMWTTFLTIIVYLFQNQRKNEKEFQKHPVTFPNPEGGGIVGQYIYRPWQNELAELDKRYPEKKNRKKE